jgi:hypothetical protein
MVAKTIYYWETKRSQGNFKASSDSEAIAKKPKNCMVLYKEGPTPDGLPFIVVYEEKGRFTNESPF